MEEKILNAITEMSKQINGLSNQFEGFRKEVDTKFSNLEGRFDTLQVQHSAEVNKAEYDKITNDIAHIKGDIESIKKDLIKVELVTSSNWNDIIKLKHSNS